MNNPNHRAALIAAQNQIGASILPPGVTSVAARLSAPVARDRKTGVTYLLHSPYIEHIELTGRAVKGGVLCPARTPPAISGAVPHRHGLTKEGLLASLLALGLISAGVLFAIH